MRTQFMTRTMSFIALSSFTAFSLAFAQDSQDQPAPPPPDAQQQQSPAPNGGWRRASDPAPGQPDQVAQQPTFRRGPIMPLTRTIRSRASVPIRTARPTRRPCSPSRRS
jgi:hypothetical protein